MVNEDIQVMVPVTITGQMVSDLIITALEQGSYCWLHDMTFFDRAGKQTSSLTEHPVQNLSSIKLVENNPSLGFEEFVLAMPPNQEQDCLVSFHTHQNLEKGLKVMADKCLRHFANFISDDSDAETADVFLQCCLFGEVRYG